MMKRRLWEIAGRFACVWMAIIIAAPPPTVASAAGGPNPVRGHCPEDRADGSIASGPMSEFAVEGGSAISRFGAAICAAAVGTDCCQSCGEPQAAFCLAPLAALPSPKGVVTDFEALRTVGIVPSPGLEPPIG